MPLTADRAKPAVPFGGHLPADRLRPVQPGQRRLPQDRACSPSTSRTRSTGTSPTWRMSTLLGNYVTPVPAQQRLGPRWFTGSADAIYQSLNLINDEQPDYVIVFGADHIYRMDPRQMVDQHIESGAGVTVAGIRQPRKSMADQFGVIETAGRAPHPGVPGEAHRPAGAARRPGRDLRVDGQLRVHHDALIDALRADAATRRPQARHGRQHHPDAGRAGRGERLRLPRQRRAGQHRPRPRLLARRRDARLVLRRPHGPDRVNPVFNLYNREWPIYTSPPQLPPAKFVLKGQRPPVDRVGRVHRHRARSTTRSLSWRHGRRRTSVSTR